MIYRQRWIAADLQATGISSDVVAEYDASHGGFSRATLAHEQNLLLLRLLHLTSDVAGRPQVGGLLVGHLDVTG